MNKTAIRNFAVKARQELLKRVSQRALQYGISADAAEAADSISINGNLLTTIELQQRKALLLQIQTKGYGHRVGMSQYGADAMAVAGSGYAEILAHYYRGTELVKQEPDT